MDKMELLLELRKTKMEIDLLKTQMEVERSRAEKCTTRIFMVPVFGSVDNMKLSPVERVTELGILIREKKSRMEKLSVLGAKVIDDLGADELDKAILHGRYCEALSWSDISWEVNKYWHIGIRQILRRHKSSIAKLGENG